MCPNQIQIRLHIHVVWSVLDVQLKKLGIIRYLQLQRNARPDLSLYYKHNVCHKVNILMYFTVHQ